MGEFAQTGIEDAAALLALALTPGIGQESVRLVLESANRAGRALCDLLALPLREMVMVLPARRDALAKRITEQTPALRETARRLVTEVIGHGGRFLGLTDPRYPQTLRRHLRGSAPPLLFFEGDPGLLSSPAIAVVGTRTPSQTGRTVAAGMARFAAKSRAVLVSGAAEGIDAEAHRIALDEGGMTIAVLPQGLLRYTPPEYLRRALAERRALLVSQFPPDLPWQRYAAVTRNNVIAGQARLVLVVEPRKQGGSVRTGLAARLQGKTVAVWQQDASGLAHVMAGAGCVNLGGQSSIRLERELHGLWRQSEALEAQPGELWLTS